MHNAIQENSKQMGAPLRYTWILLAMMLVACGDDDPKPEPIINNQVDTDLPDTNDAGNDAEEDTVEPPPECDAVLDIGMLTEDNTITVELEEPGPIDPASCVVDEISAGARVVKFRVEERKRIGLTATAMPKFIDNPVIPPPAAIELRTANCAPASAGECNRDPQRSFFVEPDTDYFLNISGDTNSSGVRLKFELFDVVCSAEDNGCTDGVIGKCSEDGSVLRESKCVDACDQDGCMGDSCDNVLALTVAASGTTTLTGNRSAYTDSWSAENRPGCNLSTAQAPGPTLGPDFVIRLPDLPAGTTVDLSAENPLSEGVYGFFFLDACDATNCLYARSFDGNDDNRAQYTTAEAGDLYIRVEALGDQERFFAIDVTVTP